MTKSPFVFQVFDSKNTCTEQEIPLARTPEMAKQIASRLSRGNRFKVIVNYESEFETYEHGELTEWSYPHGILGRPHMDYSGVEAKTV